LVGRAEDVQIHIERAHVDGHLYNEDAAQDWLKQIRQWEGQDQPLDDELADELDVFVDEIRAAAQLATKEAIAEQSKSWRKYVTDALANGGKLGHAFLRASKGWVATAAVKINGVLKSDPQSLLAVQRETWAAEWRADDCGTTATVPFWWDELLEAAERQQPLRSITVEQIRRVALTFPLRTAIAADGFHLRHYSQLSDHALSVIGTLMDLGGTPMQLEFVCSLVVLKEDATSRTLGSLPSFKRLHNKCIRYVVDDWEAMHEVDHVSFGPGRGAESTVWRS